MKRDKEEGAGKGQATQLGGNLPGQCRAPHLEVLGHVNTDKDKGDEIDTVGWCRFRV